MKRKSIIIILNLIMPIILLCSSIRLVSFDIENYRDNYKENNICDKTGKSEEELLVISQDIIDYLKNKDEVDLARHFNQKEVLHMVDVKNIFLAFNRVKNILIIIVFAILVFLGLNDRLNLKFLEELIKFKYKLIWIVPIGLISFLGLFDFNKYFIYFHLLFFENDLWLLNPETDLMIQMLPQIFFTKMFIKIILKFLLSYIFLNFFIRMYIKYKEVKGG